MRGMDTRRYGGVTRREALRLLGGVAAAWTVGLGGVAGAPQAEAAASSKYGGTLQCATLRDAIGFDPHLDYGASSADLQGNVYDPLINYDERGLLVGGLAERWTQPDARTYVFTLRRGVTFHDGKPFTSRDVAATIARIRDPKTAATSAATAQLLDRIDTPDPATVRLVLRRPDATFLNELAGISVYIVSAADIANGFDFKTKTNGTGPFILDRWESNRIYTMKRNPRYWQPGLPYLDGVSLLPIGNDQARMNALRSGQVGFAEYVPWQEFDTLKSEGFGIHIGYYLFNLVRLNPTKPPLDNKLVRQALNYVVDRKEIVDLAFGGLGQPIDGPLQPPNTPYYVKGDEGVYRKDWDKAKALLKQAGHNAPGDVPPVEMVSTGNSVLLDTAQVVLNQLRAFGLRISLRLIDSATLIKNRIEGTYTMQQDGLNMGIPDPDYLRLFFHSRDGVGYAVAAKFKDPRLDKLLEQGNATVGLAARQAIYAEAEKAILDDAPWIFLLWRPQAEATAKNVNGYVSLPGGVGQFSTRRMKYVWMGRA